MNELLEYLTQVNDNWQEKKVLHRMRDIIAIVFFAMQRITEEFTV